MNPLKIAIVDVIGLNYDGTTLQKKGIGGSESAIISMGKELAQLGFSVTIVNDCDSPDTSPGTYDGVTYVPIRELQVRDFEFDIVISQRTVIPFTPPELYDAVRQQPPRDWDVDMFTQLRKPTQLKILWLQDTFCWGDSILEQLVVNEHIDEVFTLSDWHTSYVTNNTHGPRRNFEVLKRHIYQTRNAINRWIDWVDVNAKDPNLFVYNASVTKGMVPLLERIWPKIHEALPTAKLKVIGGYYQFTGEPLNEAGKTVQRLQEMYKNDTSVEFTGIIPQPAIAEILAKAAYTIYPAAFPETSGISSLESINYNTPLLTCRFGALEETATDQASYYIDYAIEPNGLFPNINVDRQVDRFVNMVLKAVKDPYLHQQKQYACNNVKEVSTWDTVACQWQQHFYDIFGLTLPAADQARVDWINYRVHQVFGRRFANTEEIKVIPPSIAATSLPNRRVKLAIIDIPGMSYDGATLTKRGLGGSESAVILVAQQMAELGFNVTVFNGCDEDDSTPGIYKQVTYKPIASLATDYSDYEVVISSRTVMPFITEPFYNVKIDTARQYDYNLFKRIREHAKLKVFWMHDTFSWGDDAIEDLVLSGAVDEIWCLSDFHYHYVMNCSHGRARNYEVLRKHMWITRNGIVKYTMSKDDRVKDPDLFIFNANLSKGLDPLLNSIWPRVQQHLPQAKLRVIGGTYKLGSAFNEPSSQQNEFDKVASAHYNNPNIEFTGVVSQHEVARHSSKAAFFIYPAALPETHGISTLESLYAGTPLLTCRFGALEETATDSSYFIDYPVVPNGLFPNINAAEQTEKFVQMVVDAYNDRALYIEKSEACHNIDDIAGWDAVAMGWKRHLYQKLGMYLSAGEHQLAQYYTAKYNKLTGRRITDPAFWTCPPAEVSRKILVVSPFYNASNYIKNCILSVAQQDYADYEHWLINDASTDASLAVVQETIASLPADIRHKFKIINNNTNVGAVANQINFINNYNTDPDTIIMFLDGDDSLVNRNDLFTFYNSLHDDYDYTYGSSWSQTDKIPLISQPYPPDIKLNKTYRSYRFNWNMPYTHLRTFKIKLARQVHDSVFKDGNGNWFRAGGDNSTFYNIMEQANPARVGVVSDIVYNYNDQNPINDYKVNSHEQTATAGQILDRRDTAVPIQKSITTVESTNPKKRILIAIPTNRNIEAETFKSIYNLEVPAGYEVEFQYFWGYQVEQVRNLISHWVVQHQFDFLLAIDSDIAFPRDTLKKLLAHDVDMVTGLYIQRIPGNHTIEIMRKNEHGGVTHVPYSDIKDQGLVPVDGCGFGCVLIKNHVFKAIPYPQFIYKSAIDHAHTVSEDVYFCQQVRDRGMRIWADTSILCDHIGSFTFKV